jgi:DNA-binding Lrp family transcriptional regulator
VDWPIDAPLIEQLLNDWQRGFPLTRRPFLRIAKTQGTTETKVIDTCVRLLARGVVSRIGGIWAPGAGGTALLCAMAVPPDRLPTVANLVNAHPGVNHNYEREHALNLWFVVTGADQARLDQTLAQIKRDTALPVLRMKMVRPYHIDLGFDLNNAPRQRTHAIPLTHRAPRVQTEHRPLAALLEAGLPLVPEPFDPWAITLDCATDDVLYRLQAWLDAGTLRRIGLIVRHHEVGFTANAMTVFDIPDPEVDTVGQRLAAQPGITLCYRRERAPGWRYNLYCMVHGRSRGETLQLLHAAITAADLDGWPREVLFSRLRFKQTGARYFT